MITELRAQPRNRRLAQSTAAIPCWVVSVGVHGLVLLGLCLGFDRRGLPDGFGSNGVNDALTIIATFGAEEVPSDDKGETGVAVARGTEDPGPPPSQDLPDDAAPEGTPDEVAVNTGPAADPPMSDALPDEGPAVPQQPDESEAEPLASVSPAGVNPLRMVPKRTPVPDLSEDAGHPGGGAEGGAAEAVGRRPGFGSPDGASFFQINAQGQHFCYVVDCSNSMEEENTIEIARQELIASLFRLDVSKRFQILFYDAELHPLVSGGESVLPATTSNRRLARQFINSQQPTGRALHKMALLSALRSKPDVIFFLTDGEVPELSARDLAELKSTNRRRTQINVVEFGRGAKLERNWLEQLAREHRGNYRYRDLDAEATDKPAPRVARP